MSSKSKIECKDSRPSHSNEQHTEPHTGFDDISKAEIMIEARDSDEFIKQIPRPQNPSFVEPTKTSNTPGYLPNKGMFVPPNLLGKHQSLISEDQGPSESRYEDQSISESMMSESPVNP